MICDFCSDGHPTWRYPCTSFTTTAEGLRVVVPGDWLACDDCAALIESDHAGALAERAVAAMRAKYGTLMTHHDVVLGVTRLHGRFFEHRDGARVELA